MQAVRRRALVQGEVMKKLLVILLFLTASACQPSPVKDAEAYKIRLEASATATAAAIEAQHQAALNAEDLRQRQDVHAEVVGFWSSFYNIVGLTFVVSLAALMGAFCAFLMANMGIATHANKTYWDGRAPLAAKLIKVDRETMKLPAIAGDTFLTVGDTGLNLPMKEKQAADPQLAVANAQVSAVALVARNSRRAHREAQGDVADGLSRMTVSAPMTPVIEARQPDGTIVMVPIQEPPK